MDNILNNTLSGISSTPQTPNALKAPELTGNNQADIKTLQGAQQKPSDLLNLQKAMQVASSQAYKDRQATEMGITSQQFDPTKVSGGTFASIIGNLEQQRGMDIGKIYSSTMETYKSIQQEISRRMEYLQELEENKRRWEEEMKMKKEEIKRIEKQDKEAGKLARERFEEEKKQFEMNFNKKSGGGSGSSSGADYYNDLISNFKQVDVGPDGYLASDQFNSFFARAVQNANSQKELSSVNDFVSEIRNLGMFNPNDLGYKGIMEEW